MKKNTRYVERWPYNVANRNGGKHGVGVQDQYIPVRNVSRHWLNSPNRFPGSNSQNLQYEMISNNQGGMYRRDQGQRDIPNLCTQNALRTVSPDNNYNKNLHLQRLPLESRFIRPISQSVNVPFQRPYSEFNEESAKQSMSSSFVNQPHKVEFDQRVGFRAMTVDSNCKELMTSSHFGGTSPEFRRQCGSRFLKQHPLSPYSYHRLQRNVCNNSYQHDSSSFQSSYHDHTYSKYSPKFFRQSPNSRQQNCKITGNHNKNYVYSSYRKQEAYTCEKSASECGKYSETKCKLENVEPSINVKPLAPPRNNIEVGDINKINNNRVAKCLKTTKLENWQPSIHVNALVPPSSINYIKNFSSNKINNGRIAKLQNCEPSVHVKANVPLHSKNNINVGDINKIHNDRVAKCINSIELENCEPSIHVKPLVLPSSRNNIKFDNSNKINGRVDKCSETRKLENGQPSIHVKANIPPISGNNIKVGDINKVNNCRVAKCSENKRKLENWEQSVYVKANFPPHSENNIKVGDINKVDNRRVAKCSETKRKLENCEPLFHVNNKKMPKVTDSAGVDEYVDKQSYIVTCPQYINNSSPQNHLVQSALHTGVWIGQNGCRVTNCSTYSTTQWNQQYKNQSVSSSRGICLPMFLHVNNPIKDNQRLPTVENNQTLPQTVALNFCQFDCRNPLYNFNPNVTCSANNVTNNNSVSMYPLSVASNHILSSVHKENTTVAGYHISKPIKHNNNNQTLSSTADCILSTFENVSASRSVVNTCTLSLPSNHQQGFENVQLSTEKLLGCQVNCTEGYEKNKCDSLSNYSLPNAPQNNILNQLLFTGENNKKFDSVAYKTDYSLNQAKLTATKQSTNINNIDITAVNNTVVTAVGVGFQSNNKQVQYLSQHNLPLVNSQAGTEKVFKSFTPVVSHPLLPAPSVRGSQPAVEYFTRVLSGAESAPDNTLGTYSLSSPICCSKNLSTRLDINLNQENETSRESRKRSASSAGYFVEDSKRICLASHNEKPSGHYTKDTISECVYNLLPSPSVTIATVGRKTPLYQSANVNITQKISNDPKAAVQLTPTVTCTSMMWKPSPQSVTKEMAINIQNSNEILNETQPVKTAEHQVETVKPPMNSDHPICSNTAKLSTSGLDLLADCVEIHATLNKFLIDSKSDLSYKQHKTISKIPFAVDLKKTSSQMSNKRFGESAVLKTSLSFANKVSKLSTKKYISVKTSDQQPLKPSLAVLNVNKTQPIPLTVQQYEDLSNSNTDNTSCSCRHKVPGEKIGEILNTAETRTRTKKAPDRKQFLNVPENAKNKSVKIDCPVFCEENNVDVKQFSDVHKTINYTGIQHSNSDEKIKVYTAKIQCSVPHQVQVPPGLQAVNALKKLETCVEKKDTSSSSNIRYTHEKINANIAKTTKNVSDKMTNIDCVQLTKAQITNVGNVANTDCAQTTKVQTTENILLNSFRNIEENVEKTDYEKKNANLSEKHDCLSNKRDKTCETNSKCSLTDKLNDTNYRQDSNALGNNVDYFANTVFSCKSKNVNCTQLSKAFKEIKDSTLDSSLSEKSKDSECSQLSNTPKKTVANETKSSCTLAQSKKDNADIKLLNSNKENINCTVESKTCPLSRNVKNKNISNHPNAQMRSEVKVSYKKMEDSASDSFLSHKSKDSECSQPSNTLKETEANGTKSYCTLSGSKNGDTKLSNSNNEIIKCTAETKNCQLSTDVKNKNILNHPNTQKRREVGVSCKKTENCTSDSSLSHKRTDSECSQLSNTATKTEANGTKSCCTLAGSKKGDTKFSNSNEGSLKCTVESMSCQLFTDVKNKNIFNLPNSQNESEVELFNQEPFSNSGSGVSSTESVLESLKPECKKVSVLNGLNTQRESKVEILNTDGRLSFPYKNICDTQLSIAPKKNIDSLLQKDENTDYSQLSTILQEIENNNEYTNCKMTHEKNDSNCSKITNAHRMVDANVMTGESAFCQNKNVEDCIQLPNILKKKEIGIAEADYSLSNQVNDVDCTQHINTPRKVQSDTNSLCHKDKHMNCKQLLNAQKGNQADIALPHKLENMSCTSLSIAEKKTEADVIEKYCCSSPKVKNVNCLPLTNSYKEISRKSGNIDDILPDEVKDACNKTYNCATNTDCVLSDKTTDVDCIKTSNLPKIINHTDNNLPYIGKEAVSIQPSNSEKNAKDNIANTNSDVLDKIKDLNCSQTLNVHSKNEINVKPADCTFSHKITKMDSANFSSPRKKLLAHLRKTAGRPHSGKDDAFSESNREFHIDSISVERNCQQFLDRESEIYSDLPSKDVSDSNVATGMVNKKCFDKADRKLSPSKIHVNAKNRQHLNNDMSGMSARVMNEHDTVISDTESNLMGIKKNHTFKNNVNSTYPKPLFKKVTLHVNKRTNYTESLVGKPREQTCKDNSEFIFNKKVLSDDDLSDSVTYQTYSSKNEDEFFFHENQYHEKSIFTKSSEEKIKSHNTGSCSDVHEDMLQPRSNDKEKKSYFKSTTCTTTFNSCKSGSNIELVDKINYDDHNNKCKSSTELAQSEKKVVDPVSGSSLTVSRKCSDTSKATTESYCTLSKKPISESGLREDEKYFVIDFVKSRLNSYADVEELKKELVRTIRQTRRCNSSTCYSFQKLNLMNGQWQFYSKSQTQVFNRFLDGQVKNLRTDISTLFPLASNVHRTISNITGNYPISDAFEQGLNQNPDSVLEQQISFDHQICVRRSSSDVSSLQHKCHKKLSRLLTRQSDLNNRLNALSGVVGDNMDAVRISHSQTNSTYPPVDNDSRNTKQNSDNCPVDSLKATEHKLDENENEVLCLKKSPNFFLNRDLRCHSNDDNFVVFVPRRQSLDERIQSMLESPEPESQEDSVLNVDTCYNNFIEEIRTPEILSISDSTEDPEKNFSECFSDETFPALPSAAENSSALNRKCNYSKNSTQYRPVGKVGLLPENNETSEQFINHLKHQDSNELRSEREISDAVFSDSFSPSSCNSHGSEFSRTDKQRCTDQECEPHLPNLKKESVKSNVSSFAVAKNNSGSTKNSAPTKTSQKEFESNSSLTPIEFENDDPNEGEDVFESIQNADKEEGKKIVVYQLGTSKSANKQKCNLKNFAKKHIKNIGCMKNKSRSPSLEEVMGPLIDFRNVSPVSRLKKPVRTPTKGPNLKDQAINKTQKVVSSQNDSSGDHSKALQSATFDFNLEQNDIHSSLSTENKKIDIRPPRMTKTNTECLELQINNNNDTVLDPINNSNNSTEATVHDLEAGQACPDVNTDDTITYSETDNNNNTIEFPILMEAKLIRNKITVSSGTEIDGNILNINKCLDGENYSYLSSSRDDSKALEPAMFDFNLKQNGIHSTLSTESEMHDMSPPRMTKINTEYSGLQIIRNNSSDDTVLDPEAVQACPDHSDLETDDTISYSDIETNTKTIHSPISVEANSIRNKVIVSSDTEIDGNTVNINKCLDGDIQNHNSDIVSCIETNKIYSNNKTKPSFNTEGCNNGSVNNNNNKKEGFCAQSQHKAVVNEVVTQTEISQSETENTSANFSDFHLDGACRKLPERSCKSRVKTYTFKNKYSKKFKQKDCCAELRSPTIESNLINNNCTNFSNKTISCDDKNKNQRLNKRYVGFRKLVVKLTPIERSGLVKNTKLFKSVTNPEVVEAEFHLEDESNNTQLNPQTKRKRGRKSVHNCCVRVNDGEQKDGTSSRKSNITKDKDKKVKKGQEQQSTSKNVYQKPTFNVVPSKGRHTKKKYLKICSYCKEFTADSRVKMVDHWKNSHRYKCNRCHIDFKTQTEKSYHRKIHINQIHHCMLCNMEYIRLTGYRKHLRSKEHLKIVNAQKNAIAMLLNSCVKDRQSVNQLLKSTEKPNTSVTDVDSCRVEAHQFDDITVSYEDCPKPDCTDEIEPHKIEHIYHQNQELTDLMEQLKTSKIDTSDIPAFENCTIAADKSTEQHLPSIDASKLVNDLQTVSVPNDWFLAFNNVPYTTADGFVLNSREHYGLPTLPIQQTDESQTLPTFPTSDRMASIPFTPMSLPVHSIVDCSSSGVSVISIPESDATNLGQDENSEDSLKKVFDAILEDIAGEVLNSDLFKGDIEVGNGLD